MTSDQQQALERVRSSRELKHTAERSYRDAMVGARRAGCTFAVIAAAAGIAAPSAHDLIARHKKAQLNAGA